MLSLKVNRVTMFPHEVQESSWHGKSIDVDFKLRKLKVQVMDSFLIPCVHEKLRKNRIKQITIGSSLNNFVTVLKRFAKFYQMFYCLIKIIEHGQTGS